MTDKTFVEIVVDNANLNTDKLFTYFVPEKFRKDIFIGVKVLVPFGNGNKKLEGIVINIIHYTKIDIDKIKPIEAVFEEGPCLNENLIKLSVWMKKRYIAQYNEILKTMLPTGTINKVRKRVKLNTSFDGNFTDIKSKNQILIINYLRNNGETDLKKIKEDIGITNINSVIDSLYKKGIINVASKMSTNTNIKYEKYVKRNFSLSDMDKVLNDIKKNAIKQTEVINYLKKIEVIKLKNLMIETNCNLSTIKSLEKKGLIKIEELEVKRNAITKEIAPFEKVVLTKEQKYCVDKILSDYQEKRYNKFLIHGVTGSGKTEIYLQLIEKALEIGKQAIVLVPEISLTPQTIERFAGRFKDNVAVLHSRLSPGERYDEWRKIKEGKVQIVVGARSAIFAPFDNLAFIIIDEEHESSYKSSMNPKYSAIEVGEKRCEIEGATLILGSATPSIDSYYKAKKGEFKLLELKNRVNNYEMPEIHVIDMKEELDKGNKSMFSNALYNSILENLKAKKQTILFLNRRGFSTFISCRKCGFVVKCKQCDISMTYHLNENILRCHYCGFTQNPPTICPDCNSKYIKYFGVGTEKVEEEVKRLFPQARVARADVDTTTKKGSHEAIFSKMKKGNIDILIGTQMISKGLDFPNVTLVGIIAADITLNLPDFKASERTFQLLTQVSGRAGRGEYSGKVILQTYEPNHYSILTSKANDYIGFYNKEISIRRAFNYPPFTEIINIIISGEIEKDTIEFSNIFAEKLLNRIANFSNRLKLEEIFLGPMDAPIYKIKRKYRRQILIKTEKEYNELVTESVEWVYKNCDERKKYKDINVNIDINPISII